MLGDRECADCLLMKREAASDPDSAARFPPHRSFRLVLVHTFTDDDVVEPSGGQPSTKINLPQEVGDPGIGAIDRFPTGQHDPSSRCGDSSQFVVSGCLGSSELHSVDAHHSVRPVAIQPGRREVPHLEGGAIPRRWACASACLRASTEKSIPTSEAPVRSAISRPYPTAATRQVEEGFAGFQG